MSETFTIKNGNIVFMSLNRPHLTKDDAKAGKTAAYKISVEVPATAENKQLLAAIRTATGNNKLGNDEKEGVIKFNANSIYPPLVVGTDGEAMSDLDESGRILTNENVQAGGAGVTGIADVMVSVYRPEGGRGGINLKGVALKSIEVDEEAQKAASGTSFTLEELLKAYK